MKKNILHETLKVIKESRHTIEEIVFIGCTTTGEYCTWKDFEILANCEYDSGFGCQEIRPDLIIVFTDGLRMWRNEYDGCEWWEYSEPLPYIDYESKRLTNLFQYR